MAANDFSQIGGTRLLQGIRRERNAAAVQPYAGESGLQYGLRTGGYAIGQAIRAGLNKTGITKDREYQRAEAVDAARQAAVDEVKGQQFESPFQRRIAQGEALTRRLRDAGLIDEAAKADTILDGLRMQALEFRVLEGKANETKAPDEPKDALLRLQNERESLQARREDFDPGSPAWDAMTRRISEVQSKIDKEITIVGRTPQDLGPGKTTVTKLYDLVQTQRTKLDQINNAIDSFDPNDYTFQGQRIELPLLRAKDKFNALSPEEKAELTRRTESTQALITNLNAYVQEITGAAVGTSGKGFLKDESEEGRIRRSIPDPDNDSPTEIASKLSTYKRDTAAVMARAGAALNAPADQLDEILATPLDDWIVESPEQPEEADSADSTRAAARAILGI